MLRAAFEGRIHPLLFNFLLVLNDHDRSHLLTPVRDTYRTILERRTGKVRVSVRSAVPLEDYQRERLTQILRDKLQREPLIDTTVEPDLLGGLVVQVGDYLFDGSVRSQVETLRHQLIESSSHEIQTGRDRFSSAG